MRFENDHLFERGVWWEACADVNYEFGDGENNDIFALDSDGTLRKASNADVSGALDIRVRAGSYQKDFSISVVGDPTVSPTKVPSISIPSASPIPRGCNLF